MGQEQAVRIAELKLSVLRRHGICRHATRESLVRAMATVAPNLTAQQILDLARKVEGQSLR